MSKKELTNKLTLFYVRLKYVSWHQSFSQSVLHIETSVF